MYIFYLYDCINHCVISRATIEISARKLSIALGGHKVCKKMLPQLGKNLLRVAETLLDPVHKTIPISGLAKTIIARTEFQRLRRLKQMGCSYLVFPTAEHSRYVHSIGVYHLARVYAGILSRRYPISATEIELIAIGGLMHDIGHGPLSHLFEKFTKKPHEEYSIEIAARILDSIPGLLPIHSEFVLNVISPTRDIDQYMFSIVANKATGIDVDRMDYLKRDSQSIGLSLDFDIQRLFAKTRITNGILTYSGSERGNILEFFRAREYMYKNIYTVAPIQAAELMVVDMFRAANIPIPATLDEYLMLDDEMPNHLLTTTDLGARILRRDFYKLVAEYDAINTESAADHSSHIIKTFTVGYGCVDHPWDHIKFHDDKPSARFSTEVPDHLKTTMTRVFTP